jgi:hypothetical protein
MVGGVYQLVQGNLATGELGRNIFLGEPFAELPRPWNHGEPAHWWPHSGCQYCGFPATCAFAFVAPPIAMVLLPRLTTLHGACRSSPPPPRHDHTTGCSLGATLCSPTPIRRVWISASPLVFDIVRHSPRNTAIGHGTILSNQERKERCSRQPTIPL